MRWAGLPKELRSHGLKVQVHRGWRQHGYDGLFAPSGVMWHDDVTPPSSGDAPALGYVTKNRLYHIYIGRSGKVYVIGAKKMAHAGRGGPHRWIPKDAGNTYGLGIACANWGAGREKYSKAQMDSLRIVTQVCLSRMGRSAGRTTGHKNYTSRKIDPSFNVAAFRRTVTTSKETKTYTHRWGWPPPGSRPVLRRGVSRGMWVRRAKRALRYHGYPMGRGPGFSKRMERTTRKFQRSRRLGVDGVIGPQTWRALDRTKRG